MEGSSWNAVEELWNLPRYYAMCEEWLEEPPTALLLMMQVGYKKRPRPGLQEFAETLGIVPEGLEKPPQSDMPHPPMKGQPMKGR